MDPPNFFTNDLKVALATCTRSNVSYREVEKFTHGGWLSEILSKAYKIQ